MDQYWGRVQEYMNAIFAWQGMDGLVAEETAVLPGMEELASLMQITYLADSGDYDVIVIDRRAHRVDAAAAQLSGYGALVHRENLSPFSGAPSRWRVPLMKRFSDVPLPDEDVFDSIKELVVYLERMAELLGDGNVSSMRLVLNPEKMVVKEAQRAYTYLSLYGYSVDAVVCNRVFPQSLTDSYFDGWKRAQAENLELVEAAFQPLPIFQVPLFQEEVTGVEMLRQMGDVVFGEEAVRDGAGDPTQKFFVGQPQKVYQDDGHYVLSLALPLVEREEVKLHRSVVDELVVRIGNWKRNVSLPLGLAKLDVDSAKFEDDRLNLYFKLPPAAQGQQIEPEELTTTPWERLKAALSG